MLTQTAPRLAYKAGRFFCGTELRVNTKRNRDWMLLL